MIDARWTLGAALLSVAVPAHAETLTINSGDPAAADVTDLLSISVERFDGEDGAAFAQALEAELAAATFHGSRFYRVVAPESGAPTDALVTGTIRASVDDVPVIEKRRRCTEYDPADKKKCIKEIDVDIRCRRRTAVVATTVRLVAIGDGSIRYTRPLNARDQVTLCPDRSAPQSVEDYFAATFRNQVRAIRDDLAPRSYSLDVRVDESTKGLNKPAQAAFKAAVRLTKTDQAGACAAWNALTRDVEPTAALAFNLGLCNEMKGDLDAAADWYGDAQRQGARGGAVPEALARLDRHRRALAAWTARKGAMGAE
ncbi:hypothetical protein [Sphingopyxis sp. LK2115]|jgi:hypothetical protein|uniref:hypothetical protein n=1 Tax=Sphingopyxis sp. LK2115 TaxID=2744558 RepID=UPI00166034BE|nr:hypothetical protein [Sphingopyxis sp. LK2115]